MTAGATPRVETLLAAARELGPLKPAERPHRVTAGQDLAEWYAAAFGTTVAEASQLVDWHVERGQQ
ncbi:hypothetical protein QWY28_17480 [Nocardioides sp. SOB77]|uniref:Uncharacterized protein n=1 Tax=Nocardioides oceani TaxID=3058369 RepID=A0ABT8FJ95_9ACTN|nr:hypothetical protein [Nocardioides oceani]MDN4174757.1 hypothetical protein [Nocardioides oceani]